MNINKYIKTLTAAVLVAISASLSGCSEDLDYPPLEYPVSDLTANTTILELKQMYWQSSENYATLVEKNAEGEDIIIRGRVIGNDITGNIYQQIIIQDETAAITISVAKSDIYKGFPLGEEVFVKVSGLYVGKYAALFQIGALGTYNNASTTSKMDETVFDNHVERNGAPEVSKLITYTLTIPEILAMNSDADAQKWQSQLVKIENVSFVDGGTETWATQGSNGDDRYLTTASGQQLLVRNSGKSSFCVDYLPAGTGTVVGILQRYTSKWQYVFRTNEDCFGFTPGSGAASGEVVTSLSADFEGGIPTGWTNVAVDGNAKWFQQTYSGSSYAACTGYNKTPGTNGFDSWLISPGLNVDGMTEKVLSFESMVGYSNSGTLEVYAMSSADPRTATLTKLNANIPAPTGSWSEAVASNISLADYSGVIYIGFRYVAETSAVGYTTYRIDNVVAGQSAASTPETPGTTTAPTYRIATSIVDGGEYALVVDGQIGTAISETLAYGRLAMSAVSISNGEFTSDAKNALVFKAVSGGYTIQDCYGRYLSMDTDPSHLTSFQLYSGQEAGSVWVVTVESDGTATIINTLYPNVRIVRSGTYANIAPSDIVSYPTYTSPTIYQLIK